MKLNYTCTAGLMAYLLLASGNEKAKSHVNGKTNQRRLHSKTGLGNRT